jgi:pyruvate-formate lyase-activating enzyme
MTNSALPHVESTAPLFKKSVPEDLPVTAKSTALFRFGEQCNNACPMCSNTGEAGLFFHPTAELLRRAAFLRQAGFRRVVVTGGEATIHPGFWTVIDDLAAHRVAWDINTHGRSFADPRFARRAVDAGLERAIVSLHALDPATSAAIFGTGETAHHETVAGIERLLEVEVAVMVNCVLTRLSLDQLENYLREGHRRFGRVVTFKFVFPSTVGKGGQWSGIALRYGEVRAHVRRLRALALELRQPIVFESFPNCIVEDPHATNLARSAFGESHYLDDASGDRVYAMRHIEAELSAFADTCRACAALRRCSGLPLGYAKRHGVDELEPFPTAERAPGVPA